MLVNMGKLNCRTAGICGWVCDYKFLYFVYVDELYVGDVNGLKRKQLMLQKISPYILQ